MHSQEELEPLLAPLKEQMREDGNHKTTYDFFVSRVQKNLHVALCMVSVGSGARRMRASPPLGYYYLPCAKAKIQNTAHPALKNCCVRRRAER